MLAKRSERQGQLLIANDVDHVDAGAAYMQLGATHCVVLAAGWKAGAESVTRSSHSASSCHSHCSQHTYHYQHCCRGTVWHSY
jgi:hypothetical protein